MASLTRLNGLILRKFPRYVQPVKCISTSKKSQDTVAVNAGEKVDLKPEKNWVSYGFDHTSQKDDEDALHGSFFLSVSLCMVIGGFVWAYAPDQQMQDWAQREAFLEIRRREKLGLELVDPNLIDPAVINLPSDEELGETEIII